MSPVGFTRKPIQYLLTPKPANTRRGLKDHVFAVAFIKEFPIGSTLSTHQFDDWAERQGLLRVPQNVAKNSVVWKAHLQDRHQCKMRLNRGSSHPRLIDEGLTPFALDSVGQGTLEVRSPQQAVIHAELPRKVQSVADTKRRQLKLLMQSIDWSVIPTEDRLRAETIVDDIDEFTELLRFKVDEIDRKYNRLEQRIRLAVESGELKPRDAGIHQFITAPEPQAVQQDLLNQDENTGQE